MDRKVHTKLCRLCLCNSKCFMDVFEENASLGFTVAKTLEDLLQLKVTGDKYPWLACSTCIEKLIDFRLFKSRCLDSKVTFEKRFQIGDLGPAIDLNDQDLDDSEVNDSHEAEKSWKNEEYHASDMCKVVIKMENTGESDSDEIWEMYDDGSLVTDAYKTESSEEKTENGGISSTKGVSFSEKSTTVVSDAYICEENLTWIKNEPTRNEESKREGNTEVAEVIGGDEENNEFLRGAINEVQLLHFNVSNSREKKINNNALLCEQTRMWLSRGVSVVDPCSQDSHNVDVSCRNQLEAHLVNLITKNENSKCEPNFTPIICRNGTTGGVEALNGFIETASPGNTRVGGSRDVNNKQLNIGASSSRIPPGNKSNLECLKCRLRFTSSSRYNNHLNRHKDLKPGILLKAPRMKPYQCKVCSRTFTYFECYKTHISIHSEMLLNQCTKCKKFFERKEWLLAHMKTHDALLPHDCQYCDKSFRSKRECLVHECNHIGARKFLCQKCDSTYYTKAELKSHELVHSDLRPFECSICGSTFKREQSVKIHQRVVHHVKSNLK